MNHHGRVPGDPFVEISPPPEFRSTFPVQYYLMDFGLSVHFSPDSDPRKRLVKPFKIGREQRPPEADGREEYDPFAADVYSMARVFYAAFKDIVPDTPGFLELLQDMSSFNPSSRISAAVARNRLEALRYKMSPEALSRVRDIKPTAYYVIPRGFWRTVLEIARAGQWWLVCCFVWASFRIWLRDRKKAD